MNLQYEFPDELLGRSDCLDFVKHVESWRQEPDTCLSIFKGDDFTDAMGTELQNWTDHDVFDIVDDLGQPRISCRWVFSKKSDGRKKARLVARGFEDPAIDSIVKDSPTCSRDSLRLILTLAAAREWNCGSIDIKSAFLQGDLLKRDVYLVPPNEMNAPGKLLKLKRSVYGLADAPRLWYMKVKDELLEFNLSVSKFDPGVFFLKAKDEISGIICLHVDDFF